MLKAVLFDLDGTILDTEKYYRVLWPKAMAHYGYVLTDEMTLSLRSLGRPFAPKKFKEWFGEDFDYNAVRGYRKEIFKEMVETYGISLKPGVREVLDYLKSRNIVTAICTATDMERTTDYLNRVGLTGCFDKIISATMVERGKPAPDVYQFAVKELSLKPEECIAVEDAPNGIHSAYGAGLKVIMVPDQTGPTAELRKELFACVDSLADIPELLENGRKAVIFDLDGTLWDSSHEVVIAWNMALKEFPELDDLVVTDEDMYHFMGNSMDVIMDMLLKDYECDRAYKNKVLARLVFYEHAYLNEHGAVLYPGFKETMLALKQKYDICIVSNSQDGYIQCFLHFFGLFDLFDDYEMFGRTNLNKGDNIRLVMERNHYVSAVYVGDTSGDETASKEAGIPFIHASYGFGTAVHPAAVIKNLGEIPGIIEKII